MKLTPNDFLFTGEQMDPESSLYYLRARYYDPSVGRFISRDPLKGILSDPQTLHPYTYVGNNPIDRTDPSGKFWDYPLDVFFIGLDIATCDWESLAADLLLGAVPGVPAVVGVTKRVAKVADKAADVAQTVNIVIKHEHAARHLVGKDISVDAVDAAIKSDLAQTSIKAGDYTVRRIQIGGTTVEYRAQKLQDGTISVGTYYIP